MAGTFPQWAVRDVAVRYYTPGNCAPDFVSFSLDFEPLEAGRLGCEFVDDLDYGFDEYEQGLHAEYAPAIRQGVLLNLSGSPQPAYLFAGADPGVIPVGRLDNDADGPLIAVRVVLRRVAYSLVDSSADPHRYAGWRAAHKARCALSGRNPDPDRRDRITTVANVQSPPCG